MSEEFANLWPTLMVVCIVVWSLTLIITIYNAYEYLYKLSRWKFIPISLTYLAIIASAILSIIYSCERLTPSSGVNTNEADWVFFFSNLRLAAQVGCIGFAGMVIELILKVRLMETSIA